MNNKSINQKVHLFCTLGGKIPIAMRMIFFFLFVLVFQLQAEHLYSQNAKISLDIKNASIEKILQTIEERSEYYFLYNSKLIDVDRKMDIQAHEESIASVLDRMFGAENVEYEVKGTQIILHPKEMNRGAFESKDNVQQQKRQITGKVTDERGESIIGASVIEKGTTSGTVTDIDGNFTISVGEGAVLQISYIGYHSYDISTEGRTFLEIVLREDIQSLEELVVIGYGSTRKDDLSMAVSSVKLDQTMKSRPSDMNTLLQGRMPGVTIQMSGGDPLLDPTISIRGRGSRGDDRDPKIGNKSSRSKKGDGVFFVVDGVPNAPYNVEDIETVTVLKDAASAAIYGASVGSGGVVIITTKQAVAGKTRVDVNVSHSISQVQNLPKVLTAEEYNMVWKTASDKAGTVLPQVANPELYPYGNVTRTDWLDEIFRTGHLQHYAVSLSGGAEKIKALGSFSYDKNQGTLLNTYSEKMGGKLNIDFQIAKWLLFRENVSFQYTNGQGDINASHEGPILEAIAYPRSATVYEYDKDGNPVLGIDGEHLYGGTIPMWAQADVSGFGNLRNPVASLKRLRKRDPKTKLFSTSTLEIRPISGLMVKSDFTAGLVTEKFVEFVSKAPEYGRSSNDNFRTIRNDLNTNWLWETIASYSLNFAEKHDASIMGGYTMRYNKYDLNQTWVYGFAKEDDHSATFPQGSDWSRHRPEELTEEDAMYSFLGRASYSFDDRYFVTGSLRRDNSSRLSRKLKGQTFPAFSGAWKISSEPFFKELNIPVKLFKLRASWGRVGNVESLGYYPPYPVMMSPPNPVIFGEGLNNELYGAYQDRMLNDKLTWETSEQTGFGLDINLFNELDITVDYYRKRTKDLIDFIPVPFKMFSEKTYGNMGEVVNKGWESGISYSKTINDLSFNVYGNLSTVKNEVKDLKTLSYIEHDINFYSIYPLRSTVGQPWYSFYLLEADGVFKTQDEIDKYIYKNEESGVAKAIQKDAKPGDLKYVDTNNDGQIDTSDKTYHGSYLPKITYAFGGSLNYKGFDFSFMFQGIGGNKIYNVFKQINMGGRQGNNMISDVLDSFDFNENSGVPRLGIINDGQGNYTNASTFFLEDGSYLRLKNLTLGYSLPAKVVRSIGLPDSKVRVYLSGDNIFTVTPYSGIDPEIGNWGIDGSTYPVSRSFSVGINLNF
ncbi:MAG: TonB-dependent receptor [Tannerellaceae bacterium]|jgi:TonB-linked SusC/RagA family outer membrane protein|nr:TonB-dependent receptor [Tannerellaceae bacterium]